MSTWRQPLYATLIIMAARSILSDPTALIRATASDSMAEDDDVIIIGEVQSSTANDNAETDLTDNSDGEYVLSLPSASRTNGARPKPLRQQRKKSASIISDKDGPPEQGQNQPIELPDGRIKCPYCGNGTAYKDKKSYGVHKTRDHRIIDRVSEKVYLSII